jgi:outer membrane autotransporter protein
VCITTIFDPELVDDAETRNQIEVAAVIEKAFVCSKSPASSDCMIDTALADDFGALFGNFSVPSSEIPDILDQLAGEEFSAFADVRSASAARFHRSISRRFDLELVAGGSDDSAASESAVGDVSAPGSGPGWKAAAGEERAGRSYRDYRSTRKPWRRMGQKPEEPMPIARHIGRGGFTAWLDTHGVMGEVTGSKNADDIDYRIFGPLFGLDYGVSEHIIVGVTLGFTRNQMNTPGSTSYGTGNTYQGGVYLGAVFEKFHLVGSGRYAYSDLETRRRIRFNTLNRSAIADFDARDTSAFFEAAYHIQAADNVIVQPMISVAYNHLDQSSFEENGAGSLNLEIDHQVFDTLQSSVGLRIAMYGRDSDRRYVLPQLRLAYEREWLDKNRSMTANLPAAGLNGVFEVAGQSVTRDRAVIGVSSEVGVSDRVNLFVDYDLRASRDLLEHSLAFGFRAVW